MICPRCKSSQIVLIDDTLGFIKCNNCGYNELEEGSEGIEARKSQRDKSKYNPYKIGGRQRTAKHGK